MSTNDRIKRPPLERTGPVRNWATLLNAAASAATGGGATEQNGDRPPSLGDAISRSVALGYQVVEEYVRQGEKAARRMSEGGYRKESVTADAQDAMQLMQRMGHYASELFGTWFELVQRTGMAGASFRDLAAAAATTAASAPTMAPPATTAVRSVRARLEVRSSRPVEVALELAPEAGTGEFVVHALRACDTWKPRVDDVQVRPGDSGDAPIVAVRVPDGHPPGTYEGLIVDAATNRPVGVLRVVLLGGDQRPS